MEVNVKDYLLSYKGYDNGGQLYSRLPVEITKQDFFYILGKSSSISNFEINISNDSIFLQLSEKHINIDRKTLLPKSFYYQEQEEEKYLIIYYDVELNTVNSIPI